MNKCSFKPANSLVIMKLIGSFVCIPKTPKRVLEGVIPPEEVCFIPLETPHRRSSSALSLCDVLSHYRAPDSWIENCFWCWLFCDSSETVLGFRPLLCISTFPLSVLHLYAYNGIFFPHTYHVSDCLLGTTQAFFCYNHLANYVIFLTSERRFTELR